MRTAKASIASVKRMTSASSSRASSANSPDWVSSQAPSSARGFSRCSDAGCGSAAGSSSWIRCRSRLIVEVRCPTRSSRRSTRSFSSRDTLSRRRDRQIAVPQHRLATASGSMGSDLPRVRARPGLGHQLRRYRTPAALLRQVALQLGRQIAAVLNA